MNLVSFSALCGSPDGTNVSCRNDSRSVASTYGKLCGAAKIEMKLIAIKRYHLERSAQYETKPIFIEIVIRT